jgi:hypothetical protein
MPVDSVRLALAIEAVTAARQHLDDMENSPMHGDPRIGVVLAQQERTVRAYIEWAGAIDKLSKLARQRASEIRSAKKN